MNDMKTKLFLKDISVIILISFIIILSMLLSLLLLLIKVFFLKLRVWTSPQQVDQTEYALGVGKDIITYYEEYYDLGYPLPKQGKEVFTLDLMVRSIFIHIVMKEQFYKYS